MSIILKKPVIEELVFRKMLLSDEATMLYNKTYGGTIDFPIEKWQAWYKCWVSNNDKNYFYRYILDVENNQYVGEVAYHFQSDSNSYVCNIIIMDKYRNKGYGRLGLMALCAVAKENGIETLYDNIAVDNPSLSFFLNLGFKIEYQTNVYTRVSFRL